MQRVLIVAAAALSGTACTDNPIRKCGSFEVHTDQAAYGPDGEETFAFDFDNGFERCVSMYGIHYGTFATVTNEVEGLPEGNIVFGPDHKQWVHMSTIHMYAYFNPDSLVEGGMLDVTVGEAWLLDGSGSGLLAPAQLTSAEVEVIEYDEKGSCSGFADQMLWKMRWDVLWGEEGVQPWYRATGQDVVHFVDPPVDCPT